MSVSIASLSLSPSHIVGNSVDINESEKKKIELKCFQNKLQNTWCSTSQEIYDEILNEIPEGLSLQDILDLRLECAFDFYFRRDPLQFVKALQLKDPSFTESPYNKIRLAIIEDAEKTPSLLTNQSLLKLFEIHGVEIAEEKLNSCYDVAYYAKHIALYKEAKIPVAASDYSLNVLWVNLNPQDRNTNQAQHIFGDGLDPIENDPKISDQNGIIESEDPIRNAFMYRISEWAALHPGTEVNVWYDSALVTRQAQLNTFTMMNLISKSTGTRLQLRGIRKLDNIPNQIRIALHPATAVYFRVDILKALIIDHLMSSNKATAKYGVILDKDIMPMNKQQLFDQRTLDFLSNNGYVFNRNGLNDFENSFFIFNKEKQGAREIHKKIVIDGTVGNILRLRSVAVGVGIKHEYRLDSHYVFSRYTNFREEIKKFDFGSKPRKSVQCPPSQFNIGGVFNSSDHKAERFHFIGDGTVPYVNKGRGGKDWNWVEILTDWRETPLEDPSI